MDVSHVLEKITGERAVIVNFDSPKRKVVMVDIDADKLSTMKLEEIFKRAKEYNCDCWLESGEKYTIVCGCE